MAEARGSRPRSSIGTLTRSDQPASRGRQLLAALDYLVEESSVARRIDGGRPGVMGHSMGGGTLEAADDRPQLQAAIPLTGWNLTKSRPGVQVPTLVVGAENDTIAPVASHSKPFYNSLPSSLDKAYLELDGAGHFAPPPLARSGDGSRARTVTAAAGRSARTRSR